MESSKRFVRIPGECITLCGESLGMQISEEIEELLVEDVSYRSRQIAHVACQFMHHAKRTKLTTEDIDRALKWTSTEPVYGHSSPAAPEFQSIDNSGLYSALDSEVRLVDVAYDNPVNGEGLASSLNVSASWLSVEGLSLLNENDEPIASNGSFMELPTGATEAQYRYLSLLLEAVSGDKEDIRQVALHDLQFSAAPASVLPLLFQYMQEIMVSWRRYSSLQLVRFMRMVIALFRNHQLFLDPYAQNILNLLHGIIMDSTYLSLSDTYTHWHVRELTACALAEIIRRCNNPLSDYYKDLQTSFTQVLSSQQTPPLPVAFGTVISLCYLGGKSISDILLPVLTRMTSNIQELLEKSSPASQQDALRVYNIILVAAEILLVSSKELSEELSSQLQIFKQAMAPSLETNSAVNSGGSLDMDASNSSEHITLYEFLVELFGERLVLMLESHKKLHKHQSPLPNDQAKKPDISFNVLFDSKMQAHTDEAFRRHQMREGFVSLHHLVSSQRLVTMKKPVPSVSSNCHPFCIRMYRLPVMHNVLELSASSAQGYRPGNQTAFVTKGKIKGTRRTFFAVKILSDVGSCWL